MIQAVAIAKLVLDLARLVWNAVPEFKALLHRATELTPEEEAAFDAQLEEHFKQPHWQQSVRPATVPTMPRGGVPVLPEH